MMYIEEKQRMEALCGRMGSTMEELLGRCRRRELADRRHVLAWYLRRHDGMTCVSAARVMGITHAAVIYAERTVCTLLSAGDCVMRRLADQIGRGDEKE